MQVKLDIIKNKTKQKITHESSEIDRIIFVLYPCIFLYFTTKIAYSLNNANDRLTKAT